MKDMYCNACGGNIRRSGSMTSGSVRFAVFVCDQCGKRTSEVEKKE